MLRRWKYPKDYLDIFGAALGINNVPTNVLTAYQPTHGLGFVFGIVRLLLNVVGINKKLFSSASLVQH